MKNFYEEADVFWFYVFVLSLETYTGTIKASEKQCLDA